MSAKANVRKIFPKAGHIRYSSNGFRGYTLIWSERFGSGKRLGEGKTTAEAWSCAWKYIQQQQANMATPQVAAQVTAEEAAKSILETAEKRPGMLIT